MRIKSYFANTVQEAMAMARQELGPDAMLVNSRKSAPETRHLGDYEVVFVTELAPGEQAEAPAPSGGQKPGASDRLALQMAELKKELEGMRRTMTQSAMAPPAWRDSGGDGSDAYVALVANEVSPELAREIVQAAESRIAKSTSSKLRASPPADSAAFRGALVEELGSRFKVQPVLGRSEVAAADRGIGRPAGLR